MKRIIDLLWNDREYWHRGLFISVFCFFMVFTGILLLYVSEDGHSDMDGIVFFIIGIPLVLITIIPTAFQENLITRIIVNTPYPIFFILSFLSWAAFGVLLGFLTKKVGEMRFK